MVIEGIEYRVITLAYPVDIVGSIIIEGVNRANKEGTMPEPLCICPHPDNEEGETLVYFPLGYNIRPFEEKVKRKAGILQTVPD